jgi:hypothetical protein
MKRNAASPSLRLSVIHPAVHQRGLGEAVDLPELPGVEAPTSKEEDLSKGILEAIDMDSYRVVEDSDYLLRGGADVRRRLDISKVR